VEAALDELTQTLDQLVAAGPGPEHAELVARARAVASRLRAALRASARPGPGGAR